MLNLTKTAVCCLAVESLSSVSDASEAITYRLSKTKEMHFEDGRKAEQHLAAVKKLGCEARLDSHGGHTDVLYRSAKWQVMEVANDKLAHQWEDWMKKAGFETVHGHAANHGTAHDAHDGHDGHDHSGHDHAGHSHEGHDHGPGKSEEVSCVLPNWKTIHSRDAAETSELVALMKGLGCEVRTDDHGEHKDVSVRCPKSKHIEVASHQAAAGWQNWLRKNEFETRHEH